MIMILLQNESDELNEHDLDVYDAVNANSAAGAELRISNPDSL